MFLLRSLRIAAISATFSVACMPAYAAQFTSADFLKWKAAGRDLYIDTTVGTALMIADQNDKSHAKCLEDWYFSNKEAANKEIYGAMEANVKYHPRVVIVGMLQKKCGTFKYRNEN
ncbi:hypothetical protein [uncultured Cohaesibacter sp.]|uniref:hypothetical protein n=1 Tax=uncultured Cohaesibacter sp. TaxID=1002546 RepID=UPI002AA8AFD0|nr:hypothetical protein [uncultured Cohaesibacter sp.]